MHRERRFIRAAWPDDSLTGATHGLHEAGVTVDQAMRRLVPLSIAAIVLAGCAGPREAHLTDRVVTDAQVKAVFDDWYDGGLTDPHSCAAVVVASSKLPEGGGAVYSTVAADLAGYAARVCTHHRDLDAIKPGMANSDVAVLAGAPRMPVTGRCWFYLTASHRNEGQAVCFHSGRVTGHLVAYHWPAAG